MNSRKLHDGDNPRAGVRSPLTSPWDWAQGSPSETCGYCFWGHAWLRPGNKKKHPDHRGFSSRSWGFFLVPCAVIFFVFFMFSYSRCLHSRSYWKSTVDFVLLSTTFYSINYNCSTTYMMACKMAERVIGHASNGHRKWTSTFEGIYFDDLTLDSISLAGHNRIIEPNFFHSAS